MQKVITVTQHKGGAGKTTVAAHLAVTLSNAGLKVAALDLDPQGSFTRWHNTREDWLGVGHTDIFFSPLSRWQIRFEIQRLKNIFNCIIVDCPPHMDAEIRTTMHSADLAIVPVQPSPMDVWATEKTLEQAQMEKIPTYLLLNRIIANSKISQNYSKKLPNLLNTTLGNRVAFASAMMEGKTVTETNPSSAAAHEIWSLSAEVLKILKEKATAQNFDELSVAK